jgi:fumarate reductase subunit D
VTLVVLLGLFVLMLVHSAHRFRYTLYDGLQIKAKRTVAVLCYGAAIVGSVATLAVLRVAAQAL